MQGLDVFQVHMPEVDERPGLEDVFSKAKLIAAEDTVLQDGTHQRHVVIISPGRLVLVKDSYPPGTLPAENIEVLLDLLPGDRPLKIAVIGFTYLDAMRTDIRKAIPFFDYLLGFAYLGHAVWIFEGHSSVLEMGCRGADIVLVDQRMLPFLDEGWEEIVKQKAGVPEVRSITIA